MICFLVNRISKKNRKVKAIEKRSRSYIGPFLLYKKVLTDNFN